MGKGLSLFLVYNYRVFTKEENLSHPKDNGAPGAQSNQWGDKGQFADKCSHVQL